MLIRVCHKAEISWFPAKLHLFNNHVYWEEEKKKQHNKTETTATEILVMQAER